MLVSCRNASPFAAIRLLIGQNSADCIAADSSSCLLSSASRSLEALRIRRVAAFQTGRPVQKDVAVAGGCFRILIDGDDDRLHMLIAPALSGRETGALLRAPARRRHVVRSVAKQKRRRCQRRSWCTSGSGPLRLALAGATHSGTATWTRSANEATPHPSEVN